MLNRLQLQYCISILGGFKTYYAVNHTDFVIINPYKRSSYNEHFN